MLLLCPVSASAQAAVQTGTAGINAPRSADLPAPDASPLDIDFSGDPVLALASQMADPDAFRQIVAAALADHPSDKEAAAMERVAKARVAEARTSFQPVVDVNLSSYETFGRNFSNDPGYLVERSRPDHRTDMMTQLQVPVYGFGGFDAALQSAEARLRAAGFQRDDIANDIATGTVSAWSQVFAYQSLVRLLEGYVAAQDELKSAVDRRIEQGASSRSDLAQVASLRADGEVQLAISRRRLAAAEAQFAEYTGFPAPERLMRLPQLDEGRISKDYAVHAAEGSARVQTADAIAEAKQQEARVARSKEFPTISTGLEYGRYGLLENSDDYDLRATVNLRYRLLGGGVRARSQSAAAEADAAAAVADRVREESTREAATAWSDVQAIEEQILALESAYRAARQSRDVVVARFGALRGSLFDVADAQNVYLGAATAYILALTELDAARYVLLSRTGRLLGLLAVKEAGDRR